MQNLAHIQETELADNGLYEVIEGASTGELDPEIVRLNEELATERERGLRLLAEFDNYRRRTRQEHALAEQNGKREVLLALLDVMDDFDRALEVFVGERRGARNGPELAVAPENRRLAELQVNVGGAELHGAPEHVIEIHGRRADIGSPSRPL